MSLKGYVFSDEHKRRISEAKKGHTVSDETRRKLSQKIKGCHHTEEECRKISEGLRNSKRVYYVSPETREKIRKKLLGGKLTKEHSENISKALLNKEEGWRQNKHRIGMKYSKKWCENISNGRRESGVIIHSGGRCNRAKSGFREDIKMSVRSGWEANIIRFFNYLNIPFEYEKHWFSLKRENDRGCNYLPDFYLPTYDVYVEVKGWMQKHDEEKIFLFKKNYPKLRFSLIDSTKYKQIATLCSFKIPNWE